MAVKNHDYAVATGMTIAGVALMIVGKVVSEAPSVLFYVGPGVIAVGFAYVAAYRCCCKSEAKTTSAEEEATVRNALLMGGSRLPTYGSSATAGIPTEDEEAHLTR